MNINDHPRLQLLPKMRFTIRKKPNFFIVGLPRSGTTSLFFYLKQHPDVYMSGQKEPYYFCTDFLEEGDAYLKGKIRFPFRSEDQYLRLFQNVGNEKIIGEATTEYLYSKVAAQNIYDFNPDAKILISLRNPVDYLASLHSKLLSYGIEDIHDFKKALNVEPERKMGRNLPKGLGWPPSSLYYSDRIKYLEQVTRYLDLFPKKNIKIIFFENFIKEKLKTFTTITQFLKINTNFVPDFDTHNQNQTLRFAIMNRVFTQIGDLPIKNALPPLLWNIVARKIRKLNMKIENRKPTPDDVRNELMIKTKTEIENLSCFLNRDLLKLWGYV